MKRYDPFESMDRMFEQMMRRATFGEPMGGRSAFGGPMGFGSMVDDDRQAMPGDERPAVEAGADTELSTPMGRMEMGTNVGMPAMGIRVEPTDEGFVAIADLPGFEREEITVRLDDRRLSVEAVHEESGDDEAASWRGSRRVNESVMVPGSDELLTDEVTASYRNGVLEVGLPTADETVDDEHVIDIE